MTSARRRPRRCFIGLWVVLVGIGASFEAAAQRCLALDRIEGTVESPKGNLFESQGVTAALSAFTDRSNIDVNGTASLTKPPLQKADKPLFTLENAALFLDFSGLPDAPSTLSLEFVSAGEPENIQVNSLPLPPQSLSQLEYNFASLGFRMTAQTEPWANETPGLVGRLEFNTLNRPLHDFLFGGRKLWIVAICYR